MDHVASVHRGRPLLATLVAALALTVGVPAAAADPTPPEDGSSGNVGVHSLVDAADSPGGTCVYGSIQEFGYYNGLASVRVRPPVAFARQGKSSQRIGARLRVEAWDGQRWLVYGSSTWQYRSATPTAAATFTARRVTVDSWPHHGEYGSYRARVLLRWYARDGKAVVGRAHLYPRHYLGREDGTADFAMEDRCGGTTG